MKYNLIDANSNDIDYLKKAKLYNIFSYAKNLSEDEVLKINKYIDEHIPTEVAKYKIIVYNNKRIGCFLLVDKDDGVMLDEIFIEEKYRNKGIGTSIINNILKLNKTVYLWVYKENVDANSLYKRLGFSVIEETETRYYMKYNK